MLWCLKGLLAQMTREKARAAHVHLHVLAQAIFRVERFRTLTAGDFPVEQKVPLQAGRIVVALGALLASVRPSF